MGINNQGLNDPATQAYLKVIAVFDSSATLQQVQDAFLTSPGPSPTGEDLFETQLSGFLNAQYNSPVVETRRTQITQRPDGKFEVYAKMFFTGTPKVAIPNIAFQNQKNGTINALKGSLNASFTPPPVSATNLIFYVVKSYGSQFQILDITEIQMQVDAVLV